MLSPWRGWCESLSGISMAGLTCRIIQRQGPGQEKADKGEVVHSCLISDELWKAAWPCRMGGHPRPVNGVRSIICPPHERKKSSFRTSSSNRKTKLSSLRSLYKAASSKIRFWSLALFYHLLAYLFMLSILQLTLPVDSGGQRAKITWTNKKM